MATTRVAIAPMKAAQVRKPGGDFEIVEREVPQPGAGNVRIKVQACGVCHSDIFQIAAVAETPPAARQALSVLTAMPAHSHALALLPFGYTGAQLVDHPHDFVSRNTGVLNPRPSSFFDEHVAVTDAAGLRFDAHVSRAWLRHLSLDDLEISSCFGNLRHLHWCYRHSCCCHVDLRLESWRTTLSRVSPHGKMLTATKAFPEDRGSADYSVRRATTGSSRAALTAGYTPKTSAINEARPRPSSATQPRTTAGNGVSWRSRRARENPRATPMRPPARHCARTSTRNWRAMSRWVAPTERRKPISRVRSVTLTSVMFMMTMPPTTEETEEMRRKTRKKTELMSRHSSR